MQWFRFYSEALDDPKVQRLPGDLFKAWVNLLCLANEQDERGSLPTVDDIAFRLRLDHQKAEDALLGLKRAGLLEVDQDTDLYVIHSWEKRQPESDSSTERVRRFRAKQLGTPEETRRNEGETLQKRSGNALDKNRVEKSRVEENRADLRGAAAPQKPAPPARPIRNVPKPKDEPPRTNPQWDALVAGIGIAPATENERTLYGKAVRELTELGASPDDILFRCANYRAAWPDVDLTVPALLKHWSRMEHPPPIRPMAGRNGSRPPSREDHNDRAFREAFGDEPSDVPEVIEATFRRH